MLTSTMALSAFAKLSPARACSPSSPRRCRSPDPNFGRIHGHPQWFPLGRQPQASSRPAWSRHSGVPPPGASPTPPGPGASVWRTYRSIVLPIAPRGRRPRPAHFQVATRTTSFAARGPHPPNLTVQVAISPSPGARGSTTRSPSPGPSSAPFPDPARLPSSSGAQIIWRHHERSGQGMTRMLTFPADSRWGQLRLPDRGRSRAGRTDSIWGHLLPPSLAPSPAATRGCGVRSRPPVVRGTSPSSPNSASATIAWSLAVREPRPGTHGSAWPDFYDRPRRRALRGRHRPGLRRPRRAATIRNSSAAHHLLLAHGAGVTALRSVPAARGLAHAHLHHVRPATDSPADVGRPAASTGSPTGSSSVPSWGRAIRRMC